MVIAGAVDLLISGVVKWIHVACRQLSEDLITTAVASSLNAAAYAEHSVAL
jgi:hypothetical protein